MQLDPAFLPWIVRPARESVRRGADSATQAAWLSLGGFGNFRVAMRLWLALIGQDDRR